MRASRFLPPAQNSASYLSSDRSTADFEPKKAESVSKDRAEGAADWANNVDRESIGSASFSSASVRTLRSFFGQVANWSELLSAAM